MLSSPGDEDDPSNVKVMLLRVENGGDDAGYKVRRYLMLNSGILYE